MYVHMLSSFSLVQLFATPWTIAHQAPLSKGLSQQEYWSGSPFSPPGDLPNPGIKPASPALAGGFFYHLNHPGSSNTIIHDVKNKTKIQYNKLKSYQRKSH